MNNPKNATSNSDGTQGHRKTKDPESGSSVPSSSNESEKPAALAQHHWDMLAKESGILQDLIQSRGYRTVTKNSHLKKFSFKDVQCHVPALLIPIYNVQGKIALYQARPDSPRIKERKPIKYETLAGSVMTLDCHPSIRHHLQNPNIPLWITEGIKKGDCLVSHGCCAIALLGVWNWRGSNEHGGKTALPDWESIALNGRTIYVVFDSDVMIKPSVHQALGRLKAFLGSRGGNVCLIYLPNGNLQQKIGVDDYLSQDHTIADLIQLATTELKSLPPERSKPFCPYQTTERGFDWYKETREGSIRTPLTNFTAQITADIVEDDGVDTKRLFELEAQLEGKPYIFRVPVNQFGGMNWPIEHLGATALVYPGMGLRDHARAAVQIYSTNIERHTIYTHTGWRKVGKQWVFLHAEGAVGPDGPLSEIHVSLPTPLAGYVLPDPPSGDQLRSAIQASLRLLEAAPPTITYSLLAGTFRVVLGDTDFSFHLSGPTGAGKTELAALFQQHFGPGLDARHLPASWSSTGNALEGLTFVAKDVLMTVDDFAPAGSTADIQRYHREADRLFRAQGNRAGRQRMRADASLRGSKFPRGAILSTGEDIPKGQSLRARVLFLEVGPDTVDFQKLSLCQNDAAIGLYAQVMAAFIKWIAPQYEQISHRLKQETTELRDQVTRESFHKRTPGIVANVCVGLRYFLTFAREIGAISAKQEEDMFQQGFTVIARAATEQTHIQMGSDPTTRFFDLLNAALGSGKAHVAALSGDAPIRNENDEEWNAPSAFGWRLTSARTRENARDEWHPQGDRIGWVEHEQLYLDPEASYGAVQKMGQTNGEALPVTSLTLRKRLKEKGLLRTEPSRHPHLTVRKQIEGRRRDVLCVALDSLGPQKVDQVDLRSESPPEDTPDTKPWSTSQKKSEAQMDHENSFEINGVPKGGSDSPLSPNRGEDSSHKQAEVSHRSPLLTEKVDQSVGPLWNSREEVNLVD